MDFNVVLTFLACIIFLFIFGKIFIWPLKSIFKLVFNSVLGGVLIYIINVVGMNFGFHIGINILTSAIVGILGVPGAALLIILKIILRIRTIGDGLVWSSLSDRDKQLGTDPFCCFLLSLKQQKGSVPNCLF